MEAIQKPADFPPVREWAEIQKMHDILSNIMEGKFDLGLPVDILTKLQIVHDTLCWVLQHENAPFDNALLSLEAKVFGLGLEWVPNERDAN